jgi:hypothetical protein
VISIQRLETIYAPLRAQIKLTSLENEIPSLFVGTNPVDVFQYGQNAYHKRKEERQAPQDTFASSTLSRTLCQQNGCCPSCR